MLIFHGYASWAVVHELVLEGSFERWFSISYLHFHMLLCLLSLGDNFILGIFLGLGIISEFDLLVRGLHPWLVICYGLGIVVASCWDFMEEILANFTSRGVCRRTWYKLWFAWFLFGLGFVPRCLVFFLHWIWDWLEIVITSLCSCISCERWHGYSFISFLFWLWGAWKIVGDFLWEFFLQVIGLCIIVVLDTTWIHFFDILWVDWL